MIEHTLRTNRAQDPAVFESEARHVLQSGGLGTGKTYGLCIRLVLRARHKGTLELLVRKTGKDVKRSILRTLLVGDGDMPPVLPHGAYIHNRSEQRIEIKGGGTILYFGLDDAERIKSINATGATVEEVTELTLDDYRTLAGRVRVRVAGIPMQIACACNPDSPDHWVAEHWGIGHASGFGTERREVRHADDDGGKVAYHSRMDEAEHLDPDYIRSFDDLRGTLWHNRMILGLWAGSDRLVYPDFARGRHTRERSLGWADEFIVSVDEGTHHPFVALLIGFNDGEAHVYGERVGRRMLASEKQDAIRELVNETPHGAYVVVDSAAQYFILECQNVGIDAVGVDKNTVSVFESITQLVQPMISNDRLSVDPSCVNLVKGFGRYEWGDTKVQGKEHPVKRDDDEMDALRYGIMHHLGGECYVGTFTVGG